MSEQQSLVLLFIILEVWIIIKVEFTSYLGFKAVGNDVHANTATFVKPPISLFIIIPLTLMEPLFPLVSILNNFANTTFAYVVLCTIVCSWILYINDGLNDQIIIKKQEIAKKNAIPIYKSYFLIYPALSRKIFS
jgi:hypothetical protein